MLLNGVIACSGNNASHLILPLKVTPLLPPAMFLWLWLLVQPAAMWWMFVLISARCTPPLITSPFTPA